MIKITHKNLDEIKNNYCNLIITSINRKIQNIEETIRIIESKEKINGLTVKGNVNEYSAALKIIINKKNLGDKKNTTNSLIKNLNYYRNNKPFFRIKNIKEDILILKQRAILESVISSIPSEMIDNQKALKSRLKCNDILITSIFDYDWHLTKYIQPIANELKIDVCPYCNRNFISHVQNDKKRIIGPTFDHFFDQARNPFLTLSFYNLIPSCYICNSNLKNQTPFSLETHLHPYFDEMAENARFDFELDTTIERKDINFKPKICVDPNHKDNLRIENTEKDNGNISTFKLRDIYETHEDIVEEIYSKFDKHSPHYVKSIATQILSIGGSEQEFYRYHFGNFYETKEFKRRPLAKLTRDIYDKLVKWRPLY